MNLEDRLRAYAAKGELIHLSLAFRASDGMYHANFSAASPAAGYARGAHKDPVEAVLAAFKAAPIPPLRPSAKREKKVTAAVTDGATDSEDTTHPSAARDDDPNAGLPQDWTKP